MNPNDGKLKLVIGNRNYSSWSLRVWFWMRQRGLVFDVVRVPLFEPETDALLQGYFSGSKVPVLQHGERIVWDSLAILEYLNETFPHTKGWPEQAEERAFARSITAEMHSSFHALREALPMNCRRPVAPVEISRDVQQDIDRILAIWQRCREASQQHGPWLFGHNFTIADAFFAPVVMRFHTYAVPVDALASDYMEAVIWEPAMQEWLSAAAEETEIIEQDEV
ncbi:MAG: glutathione S-transferase family protein [Sedimenticolaceae bacterium]|nr:glutathione S-transferase family protein [Sedimenticolaceae bacterium]